MPAKWPHEEFATYLRALMTEAGIPDYAELSRLTGVNQTQFSNWRRGISRPSRENLGKVAKVLGVRPVNLWLVAGLTDEEELDLAERPDLTVLPREFIALLELWQDGRLTEQQRDFLRMSVATLVSGLRNQLGESPQGRPIGRRKVS
jgi:transcriptional regulator with XRE-family HTH domain